MSDEEFKLLAYAMCDGHIRQARQPPRASERSDYSIPGLWKLEHVLAAIGWLLSAG